VGIACGTTPVYLDIKPGSCPNPLNVKAPPIVTFVEPAEEQSFAAKTSPNTGLENKYRKAVLPVAILGTEDFDVTLIDPSTVTLEGAAATRWSLEDVTAPMTEKLEECDCDVLEPDGYVDLTMKFERVAIAEALGEVFDGQEIPLTISGELLDGTAFEGTDCVLIKADEEPTDEGDESDSDVLVQTDLTNSPNPFNPATEISFTLPEAAQVKLEVFNITGQRVATLVEAELDAGHHAVTWDASASASGVYFYKLTAGDFVETKKMMLVK